MNLPTVELPHIDTGAFVFGDAHYNKGREAPKAWDEWLRTLFPNTFTADFAQRHIQLWEWIETLEAKRKPSPSAYIDVEPRGGGKTTTMETAVVRVAARKARQFVLYVRGTQDKANESVQNIAAKMESANVAKHYPALADRKMSKYGHSRGWRVDLLRTADDFNVAALGLDAASRGVKLDDYRPDWIIFDDIDGETDSPKTIAKKLNLITKAIIPTGATHCAYTVVQNLIHINGIVNSLVEGTADFLHDRIVSGPHPAVIGLAYEARPEGGYRITGGEPTWSGQDLVTCEHQINEWGLSSFLREAQHEVEESGGIWDHIEFRHVTYAELPDFIDGQVWCDPAVTSTDASDSNGIVAGGIDAGGDITMIYAWEQVTSPEDVLKRAILKAIELGFSTVGVETDQGGDTWESVYKQAWQALIKEHPDITRPPKFASAKAGAGHGSKVHRNQQMLTDYENGRVTHMIGTHTALEKALRRFPMKPLDLADAAYWLWYHLQASRQKSGRVFAQGKTKVRIR